MKNQSTIRERTVIASSTGLLALALGALGCEAFGSEGRHAVVPLTLTAENIAHQGLYDIKCSDCHEEKPDPAEPYCFSGLSAEEHLEVWKYERAMAEDDPSFSPTGKALFESQCDDCHELPDPTQPGCFSGLTEADVVPVHAYMEEVRGGKELFESDCRGCHEELDPQAHDFEFWSEHLCNADEHLSVAQEQKVLLYLSTRVN